MGGEISATFSGIVHCISGRTAFASRRNRIYISYDEGNEWSLLCTLPLTTLQRLRSLCKLTRRLFRSDVHHIAMLCNNSIALVAYGSIYIYNLAKGQFSSEVTSICGSRPLVFCYAGGTRLYYGEYVGNPDRRPVRVFGSEDGGKCWHPVFQFMGVRHIHGVFHDPYTEAIWVTTGDTDEEAAIWLTRDHFKSVEKVLAGSQQTRVVQLLFTREYVYFGSDTPLEVNYLYRLSRQDGKVERLQEVEGSVLHGCKVGDRLFFSTACEPTKINRSRDVVVWVTSEGVYWQPFLIFRKDIWPMKLFQYGQVLFPSGNGMVSQLWLTPFAAGNSQVSLRIGIVN